MDTNDLSHKYDLIQALKRRKQERELQLAKFGINADPIIKIEIEDLEAEITKLTKYCEKHKESEIDDYLVKRFKELEQKISEMIDSINVQQDFKKGVDKSDLRLVDMSFDNNGALDVKVRNVGEQVAFLKAATFRITKIWNFKPLPVLLHQACMLVIPSANYSIELQVKEPPYSKYQMLSHSIPPNDVDRFAFSFGVRTNDNFPFGFLIKPKIIYNESNRFIKCPSITILTNGSKKYYDYFKPNTNKEHMIEFNIPMGYEIFLSEDIIALARSNLAEMIKDKDIINERLRDLNEAVSSLK